MNRDESVEFVAGCHCSANLQSKSRSLVADDDSIEGRRKNDSAMFVAVKVTSGLRPFACPKCRRRKICSHWIANAQSRIARRAELSEKMMKEREFMPSISRSVDPSVALRLLAALVSIVLSVEYAVAQQPTNDLGDDLFFFRPDTPSKRISGAILAERLDRPALAQKYLRELIESQPSAELLVSLRREFGIGAFLKLSITEELLPESRELLTLINEATRQQTPTAATVTSSIADLGQSPKQTLDASLTILSAEDDAVLPLLSADTTTTEGKLAAELLRQNVRRFRRGLLAALQESDEQNQVRIIQLLGATAAPSLALDLIKYQFSDSQDVSAAAVRARRQLLPSEPTLQSKEQAAAILRREALTLLRNAGKSFPGDEDRVVEKALAREFEPKADLSIYGSLSLKRAVKLIGDAVEIAPPSSDVSSVQLVCQLTQQAWPLTWPDQPQVPVFSGDVSQTPKPEDISAFEAAIESENSAAILQLLGQTDSAVPVIKHNRKIRKHCETSQDPRIRLMTAAVVQAAQMSTTYSTEIVNNVVAANSVPEAVVIDSRDGESASAAAVLRELKYAATAATRGTSGFRVATEQLNCDLLLVHSNCLSWTVSHTIANLRADSRTRATPIVIYGPPQDEARTAATRDQFDGVWFVAEPVHELTLPDVFKILKVPEPRLTVKERESMIRFARVLRDNQS